MLVNALNRFERLCKFGYAGFMGGYSAALLLGMSVWIEMRFNVALLIPLCSLGAVIAALKLDSRPNRWLRILPQAAAVIPFLGIYGLDTGAISVIPAVLLREGFGLGQMSLSQVNMLLVIAMLAGNGLWLRKWR
jgi:hypothetical protein